MRPWGRSEARHGGTSERPVVVAPCLALCFARIDFSSSLPPALISEGAVFGCSSLGVSSGWRCFCPAFVGRRANGQRRAGHGRKGTVE